MFTDYDSGAFELSFVKISIEMLVPLARSIQFIILIYINDIFAQLRVRRVVPTSFVKKRRSLAERM